MYELEFILCYLIACLKINCLLTVRVAEPFEEKVLFLRVILI